jgi:hypothetical protein
MVELDNEKQQRTIYKGTQSFEGMEGKSEPSNNRTAGLVQGNKRNNEIKQDKFQKRTGSVEQRQKVFGGGKKENEYCQNGDKKTSNVRYNQSKNRNGKLEGDNFGKSENTEKNGIRGLAQKSFQEGQLDVPELRKERLLFRRGSHKTIRPISEVAPKSEQWQNSLPTVPQSTPQCKTCHGEPYLRIGEFKSGRSWTQGMVDQHGQLTFYALLVWLKYGTLPKNIYLHWAKTDEDMQGNLKLTGDIKTFATQRSLKDLILFSKRIKTAWAGICEIGKFNKQNGKS